MAAAGLLIFVKKADDPYNMNLRQKILQEHSKAQCDRIVGWVGGGQDRFDALIALFFHDSYRVVQRAAWPVSCCVIKHPSLIHKHFEALLQNMHKPGVHNAVKRNTVRLLQFVQVPEKYQGEIMDLCFGYIASPTEAAAVKAFSLTILEHLSRSYPDILPEIKLVIEERWHMETPAFKSRARKILKIK